MHQSVGDEAPGLVAAGWAENERTVRGHTTDPSDWRTGLREKHRVHNEHRDDGGRNARDEERRRRAIEMFDVGIIVCDAFWQNNACHVAREVSNDTPR